MDNTKKVIKFGQILKKYHVGTIVLMIILVYLVMREQRNGKHK